MRKKIIAVLTCVFMSIGILSGCGQVSGAAEDSALADNYIPVETEIVTKNTLRNTTVIAGKVIADRSVNIVPQIIGKVENVSVKVGDEVQEDDVLFTLDKEDIQDKIDQAKIGVDSALVSLELAKTSFEQANIGKKSSQQNVNLTELSLDAAKAAYDMAKANYDLNVEKMENAKVNFERSKKLYEEGIISKSQYEQAELAASDSSLVVLKAQLDQAEAGYKQALESSTQTELGIEQADSVIKQAQAGMTQAELGYKQAKLSFDQNIKSINDGVIDAPIKGIVSLVNVQEGQMASNMQPAISIVDIDKVYVQIGVTEKFINDLTVGQEVSVNISSAADKEFIGTIFTVSPAVNQQTQLYDVKVEIDNKEHIIKPGMFAKVEFETEKRENVIAVKSECVMVNFDNSIVFIEENGKAVEKIVETGLESGYYTEILSGLNEGENIIVKGQDYVKDGIDVKVISEENETEQNSEEETSGGNN